MFHTNILLLLDDLVGLSKELFGLNFAIIGVRDLFV